MIEVSICGGAHVMQLCLTNPCNPLVSIVKVKESCCNRYRVWKPPSLMVLVGLTQPQWEASIVDDLEQPGNILHSFFIK